MPSCDICDMLIYVLYIWAIHVCAQSLSHVQPFVTPWTVALAGLLCHGIHRQEYWSGVAMPSSRGSSRLRDQTRISCIAGRTFTSEPSRKPYVGDRCINKHGIFFGERYDTHNTPEYCIFSLQLPCHSLSYLCRGMGTVQSLTVTK